MSSTRRISVQNVDATLGCGQVYEVIDACACSGGLCTGDPFTAFTAANPVSENRAWPRGPRGFSLSKALKRPSDRLRDRGHKPDGVSRHGRTERPGIFSTLDGAQDAAADRVECLSAGLQRFPARLLRIP